MTEPNEPKIVHFPPRAQAPVQDTAGNWEPDEQLFGLEELLKQEEDAIEAETETFLDKIGGLGLLMSAMVEKNALTENDIAELSAILEKAGGKP